MLLIKSFWFKLYYYYNLIILSVHGTFKGKEELIMTGKLCTRCGVMLLNQSKGPWEQWCNKCLEKDKK